MTTTDTIEHLTRPIAGMDHRSGEEVFAIMGDRIRAALTRSPCAVLAWDKEDDSVLNYNGRCIGQVVQDQKGRSLWYPELLGQYRVEPLTDYEAARTALYSAAQQWLGVTSEPVAWRMRDFADGWIYSEKDPSEYAVGVGSLVQPLYAKEMGG